MNHHPFIISLIAFSTLFLLRIVRGAEMLEELMKRATKTGGQSAVDRNIPAGEIEAVPMPEPTMPGKEGEEGQLVEGKHVILKKQLMDLMKEAEEIRKEDTENFNLWE